MNDASVYDFETKDRQTVFCSNLHIDSLKQTRMSSASSPLLQKNYRYNFDFCKQLLRLVYQYQSEFVKFNGLLVFGLLWTGNDYLRVEVNERLQERSMQNDHAYLIYNTVTVFDIRRKVLVTFTSF